MLKSHDGKATVQEIKLTFGPEKKGRITLLLIKPNKVKKPPVFVGLNFSGNHTVLDDKQIALPTGWMRGTPENKAREEDRGKEKDVWCADLLIDRGYALAVAYYGDIDPDKDAKNEDWSDGDSPALLQGRANEARAARMGFDRGLGLGRVADGRLSRPTAATSMPSGSR